MTERKIDFRSKQCTLQQYSSFSKLRQHTFYIYTTMNDWIRQIGWNRLEKSFLKKVTKFDVLESSTKEKKTSFQWGFSQRSNVMVIIGVHVLQNICLCLRELLVVISFITVFMTIKRRLSPSRAHFNRHQIPTDFAKFLEKSTLAQWFCGMKCMSLRNLHNWYAQIGAKRKWHLNCIPYSTTKKRCLHSLWILRLFDFCRMESFFFMIFCGCITFIGGNTINAAPFQPFMIDWERIMDLITINHTLNAFM